MRTGLMIAGALVALSGCAPTTAGDAMSASDYASGRCFRADQVNNFRVDSGSTVYVSTDPGYVFKLDAAPNCFGADTRSVTVTPYVRVGSKICVGEQARVLVHRSSSTPFPCVAGVSGPIADGRASGLPSRLNAN